MMPRRAQGGFTLVEMVVVIVITGIVAASVAVFIRTPVQQYMDVARRADMTDVADTALRRITRDLRLALPNSVRVAGACDGTGTGACFIEFLPTGSSSCAPNTVCLGGGRYLAGAGGDDLNFTAVDTSFDVLGAFPTMVVGDQVVVYNLGIPGADAYAGNTLATHNRRAISAVGVNNVTIVSGNELPFESPGNRFHVISTPVTYACVPAVGGVGGALTRYWGYTIQAVQTSTDSIAELNVLVSPATAARGSALLANNISSCRFTYNSNVVAQRSGLVTMQLGITEQNETITLYSAAHVTNQP